MGDARVPPPPDDLVAYLTIRMHATGTVSVSGHIADKTMALQLLDHAKDAIRRQVPDERAIVIPNRDVDVTPNIPLREWADMRPHEKGDG